MSEILLSIIVPVYNCEGYIEKCVDSLINSNSDDVEIILVNDGSTDNSFQKCTLLSEIYNNIKLINTENLGVSHARNIGIEESLGKWIMFVDADDYLQNGAVSECLNYLNRANVEMYCFGCTCDYYNNEGVYIKEQKRKIKICENGYSEVYVNSSFNELFKDDFFDSVWGKIYKKDIIIQQHIRFNECMTVREDSEFVLKYFMHIAKVGIFDEYYYHYRVIGNELSYYLRREVKLSDIAILNTTYESFLNEKRIIDNNSLQLIYKHIFLLISAGMMYIASKKNCRKMSELYDYIKRADIMIENKYQYLSYNGFYSLLTKLMNRKMYLLCTLVVKFRFMNLL